MSEAKVGIPTSIRIPLIIDGGLLLVLVSQASIGWSQLQTLREDVTALRSQIQVMQAQSPVANERMARIEEGIVYIRQDLANLRSEIHDKRNPR